MKYIGLDLHAKSFRVAVLDGRGRWVWEQTYATSGDELVRVVQAVAGRKCVVLEESTMAAWAYRVLAPHADRVVVADPCANRWIAGDENMNDAVAARKLAELLRAGLIQAVHHAPEERQLFKELVLLYHDTSHELGRAKSKLKAKFRQHGVSCEGSRVYGRADREAWLARVPARAARQQLSWLLERIDFLAEQKAEIRREVARQARAFPEMARFDAVPGIGLIRAATFFAVVDTPHRFARRSKLWTYCGLGIVRSQSGESAGPEHLTRRGNRLLKDAVKGAALSAVVQGDNPFARQQEQLLRQGVSPERAWLTGSRSMASTLWAMWRKDEPYRPRDGQRPPATGRRPKARTRQAA